MSAKLFVAVFIINLLGSYEAFSPSIATGLLTNYIAGIAELLYATTCAVHEDWPSDAKVEDGDTFDFIVVGAGSAGSVVANRLSENENWTVLLVEAGNEPPTEASVPLFMANLIKTKYDWQYSTVNDSYAAQGMVGGSNYWEKGKMLGGTSSLNGMIYIRGNPADYEQWNSQGNDDWDWETALKYFKKSEAMQDPTILNDTNSNGYHETGGFMHINRFKNSDTDLVENILVSYSELGLNILNDFNGPSQIGVGVGHGSIKNGKRESSATAFLNTIPDRTNLKILKNTLVSKVIIDYETKNATGIEIILSSGKTVNVTSTKEVIVSAGSIASPQLLMLSGIGPEEHLESLGIEVLYNSPVGEGLDDQISIPVVITGDPRSTLLESLLEATSEVTDYCIHRHGLLTSNGLTNIMAFHNIDNKTFPDFQTQTLYLNKASPALTGFCTTSFGYRDEACLSLVKHNIHKDMYYNLLVILHPQSRGRILLNSTDPKDAPIIYANYFNNTSDLDLAVIGIRKLQALVNTTYFQSINAEVAMIDSSVCDVLESDSDDYWKCIALNLVSSNYHNLGAVKMGPASDPSSVVSSKCKVHGIGNLRVIDSSVIPYMVSGNTHAPTVMIAERVSDLIKEEYGMEI